MRRRREGRAVLYTNHRLWDSFTCPPSPLTCFSVPVLRRQSQGVSRVDVETPRKSVRRSRLLPANSKSELIISIPCSPSRHRSLLPNYGRHIPESAGRRLTDHLLARIGCSQRLARGSVVCFPSMTARGVCQHRGYQSGDDRHRALQPQTPAGPLSPLQATSPHGEMGRAQYIKLETVFSGGHLPERWTARNSRGRGGSESDGNG